ncbi:MAG: hypothetical protein PPP56_03540 [Longimonas sp.]|uniref:hypothetical protein n=1 Tax=Longimonas sp. TaxID=2039626 RepID=UPI00334B2F1C
MDGSTLVTILVILAVATVLALVRTRRRDRCLKSFDGFPITLVTQANEATWGTADIRSTGLELTYPEPVVAREGHLERSTILYKEQYASVHALYRCPEGLTEKNRERREMLIEQTRNPGLFRRLGRWVRNWMGMVRDALLQSIGMIIGVAKAKAPAGGLIGRHDAQVQSISTEVVQHTGNAFDPLLERHLFSQVVVEVTVADGAVRSYCGWLKDYTSDFIEILDAYANTSRAEPLDLEAYHVGDERLPQQQIALTDGRAQVANNGTRMFYIDRLEQRDWRHPVDVVLPPGASITLALPPAVHARARRAGKALKVWMGTVDRVDMLLPRQRAQVRHAAGGSDASYEAHREQLEAIDPGSEPAATAGEPVTHPAENP